MTGNIVLIGMPASGKSTVGVVLAKTLGMGFVDTDLIIQSRQGELLQNIIDTDGLEKFLDCERDAILSVDADNCVISTGGSAVFRDEAMTFLKKNGVTVYLDVPAEILKKRLCNITTRGIAAKREQSIEEILSEREALYKKYADITLRVENENVEKTVERLVDILCK
ncbi:MAG: shikimate kinase [Clostridia bacterium]|nr:shikimate kinase [Clostridia bacterium]